MNKKYSRLIGDMGIFALGALGSKLVLFILLPIYTNVMSDSEYGIADLVFTGGDLLLPFISLAIYNGLLRFGLIKDKTKASLLNATVIFLAGTVLAVALTPLAGLYAPLREWKWYMCVYVLAHFARSNSLIYLKVKDKNKAYSVLSIAQALLLVGFNVLFLILLKWGIRGYLLSTILSNALLSILAFIIGGERRDLQEAQFDKQLFKEMILYSLPFVFNDISWLVIRSCDKFMLEGMIGAAALGIYTAASKIPSLVNALTSIFSQAWGLASIKEHDSTNETCFYSGVFRYFSTFTFGAAILIIAITKPFMSVYVGQAFRESWHYVPLLLVSAVFDAISTFAGGLFGAFKQSKYIMTSTIVAGVTNVIVNYIFIQTLGIYGAVIGTVSAHFIVALLRIISLKIKIRSLDFNFQRLGILAALVLVQAIMVGLNTYGYIVSAVTFVLYLIIAKNDLFEIIYSLKAK